MDSRMLTHPLGGFSVPTPESNSTPAPHCLASTIAEAPFFFAKERSGLRIGTDDSPTPMYDLTPTALSKRRIRLGMGGRPHHASILSRHAPSHGFSNIRAITHSISPSRRYVHVDGAPDARWRGDYNFVEDILKDTLGILREIHAFSPKFE